MALGPGTRLGPYEIVALLGVGGMGEVYRATDTHLKRAVAIKVLPDAVAADSDRLARFQREAELLASLNHPNIAYVHGLEKAGGTTALVMELVEGPTLADLIEPSGGIPFGDALPIVRQIAEALEAAHEYGIVHRDLKPANVKVRPDGAVKVLDFGLAKVFDPTAGSAAGGAAIANSPTFTAHATRPGFIIGTAAYMAPEQARGKAVDKRADVWAFGVVVYEMLTGRRMFPGDEISDVLAAVLRQDVDWSALPSDTPLRLRRLLERCLDRDPRTRLRDIGEARVEISRLEARTPDADSVAGMTSAPSGRNRREIVAWMVAAVALIVGVTGVVRRPGAEPVARAVRLPFLPPDRVVIENLSSTRISPDGQKLLFSGRGPDGRQMLWVRPLDSDDAKPLPDTEDGIEAFWSPDSRSVGFGTKGKLKRVDLNGQRAETLADAPRLVGGAWSPAGVIVFGPYWNVPLARIGANGSGLVPASPGTLGGRYPEFLPDGRHFLFWSGNGVGKQAVMVGSLDSTDTRTILPDFAPAVYVAPGWLLYARNGAVVVQPFDAARLELGGDPRPIAAAPVVGWPPGGRFSVSDTGVLVLQDPKGSEYQLTWFDRTGKAVGTLGPVLRSASVQVPRLSPDGRRVVLQRLDLVARNQDLWIGDVARGLFDRFTTDPAQEQLPIWSADGKGVICTTTRGGKHGIFLFPVTGGEPQLLAPGTTFPEDVARDGAWLFYSQRADGTRTSILAQPLSPAANGGRAPHVVLGSQFEEQSAQLSPDGHWLVYVSDVTGTSEVYVRRLSGTVAQGEATHVSLTGGAEPRWSPDGHELFFIAAPQGYSSAQMMVVPVKMSETAIDVGAPSRLFTVRMMPIQQITRDYDVSADGRRFLIGTVVGDPPVAPITVVLNWMADLKR